MSRRSCDGDSLFNDERRSASSHFKVLSSNGKIHDHQSEILPTEEEDCMSLRLHEHDLDVSLRQPEAPYILKDQLKKTP